jgi:predicted nucleotide-binding protein (sugar kinase/HSP70/actin superfamily)
MYNCLQRLVLRYNGMDKVPVIAPNQDSTFYHSLTESVGNCTAGQFKKSAWLAVIAIDLMQKAILRVRPLAADREYAQAVYKRSLDKWIAAVERRIDISAGVEIMEEIAADFATIEYDAAANPPRIGIVGEIYVRTHPFANMNLVQRLERLGAVCDVASLAEWIYYTNFTRQKMAWRRGQWQYLAGNAIQDFFQRRYEKRLAAPLERLVGPLKEDRIDATLDAARPYIDVSFEGEAILTVGKMVEYHHHGFGGVINAMPFTCMPSTVVSSLTRKISADCGDMPILNLSFDGQDDTTMPTRLEAFVEQVRQATAARTAAAVH